VLLISFEQSYDPGVTDQPDSDRCTATRTSNTAAGPVEVQCLKPAGHDGRHEGDTGMTVYWSDTHVTSPDSDPGS
jgi:hypothetical protein